MNKKDKQEKAEQEAERWLEQLNNVDGKKDEVSETMVTIMVQTSSIVFGLGAVFGVEMIDEFSLVPRVLFLASLILILGSIFFGFWIYFKKVRFWDSLGSKLHRVYEVWAKARKGEVSVEEANKVEEETLEGRITQSSPSGPIRWQLGFLIAGITLLIVVLTIVLL